LFRVRCVRYERADPFASLSSSCLGHWGTGQAWCAIKGLEPLLNSSCPDGHRHHRRRSPPGCPQHRILKGWIMSRPLVPVAVAAQRHSRTRRTAAQLRSITRPPLAYCKADALLLPAAANRSSHLLDRSRIIAGRSNCQEDCQVAGCGLVTVQLASQSLKPAAGATTCRYFGQLAQSVHHVPSLLHCKPEIFRRLCESHAGPTSSVVLQGVRVFGPPPGLYPETAADRARDPNWLHLARLVDRADVCPRYGGWGAKAWLAH
jgi:hypothetical protein